MNLAGEQIFSPIIFMKNALEVRIFYLLIIQLNQRGPGQSEVTRKAQSPYTSVIAGK